MVAADEKFALGKHVMHMVSVVTPRLALAVWFCLSSAVAFSQTQQLDSLYRSMQKLRRSSIAKPCCVSNRHRRE